MHLWQADLGSSQEKAKSIMLIEPYENAIFVGQRVSNISDFRWLSLRKTKCRKRRKEGEGGGRCKECTISRPSLQF